MAMRVVPNSPAGRAGDGGSQQGQCQEFVHAGAGDVMRTYDNKSARVNYLFV